MLSNSRVVMGVRVHFIWKKVNKNLDGKPMELLFV
jgi:hypothetical protein